MTIVKGEIEPFRNLQPGWNPDGENADIDHCDYYCRTNHDGSGFVPRQGNNAHTIDDDLKEQLDLDTPPQQNGKVEYEAWLSVSEDVVTIGTRTLTWMDPFHDKTPTF